MTKLSTKEVQSIINSRYEDSHIEFINDYLGDKIKHDFKCKKCNHIWETTPNTLKRKASIGCPNCHKIKKQKITTTKKKEIKIDPSITKLLNNQTIPYNTISDQNLNQSHIQNLQQSIDNYKNTIKNLLEEKSNLDAQKQLIINDLNAIEQTRVNFNPIFIILLLPIWIIYTMSFSKKLEPSRNKLYSIENTIRNIDREIENLNYEIKKTKGKISQEKQKVDNIVNLKRLKNRLDISIGGSTNLYYFRFFSNGKNYYKIGITVNSVYERYKNNDGSSYGAIKKVFFDQPIKNTEQIERTILKAFKDKLANDKSLLRTKGGYSEVFIEDVLDLDNY